MSSAAPLMKASGLRKAYKGRVVVNDVGFEVGPSQIVGLMGPNGAGKTTSFYMVVGLVAADAGMVEFEGQDVSRLPMFKRCRMGMGYLAQEPSIFRRLTVEENILAILETLELSATERRARMTDLIDELGLGKVAKQQAITLSGGERRRLEIARALTTTPRMLLLDEPFAGVDPIAVHEVQQIVLRLRDRGISILITDHNVRETLSIVDKGYIMYQGTILCEGSAEHLSNDPKAREIYLGPGFQMANA